METNKEEKQGGISMALKDVDVCIALSTSGPGVIKKEWVSNMADNAIMFACANPVPEIWPWDAKEAGVKVVATGRSDFPNQVNNSLCFPGLFRGVLDVRASEINDDMKVAAAVAIASVIPESNISSDFIIPSVFDHNVARLVAKNVSKSAIATGVARRKRKNIDEIYASFKPKR